MAYDLDRPTIVATLEAKIQGQEANLRGLETYSRGARYTLYIGLAPFVGAVTSWFQDYRTLAAWLIGYAVLACVTYYLFAPLLTHYTQSAYNELNELKALHQKAVARQKELNP